MAIETEVQDPTPTIDFTQQPGYIIAADNHNVASGNGSWFSSVAESISNAPKFWTAAIGSGITGIINSGIAVANLFNDEQSKVAEINYGKWLQDYDEDLGKYYRENKDSVDTWGFVVTSFAPGMAGIKALNLGQKYLQTARATGQLGPMMSKATGLLVPRAESYMSKAATELAATNQAFKLTQSNVLKAIGLKTGQQALEAAAFETFVVASSFKSPFFEDMEAKDIAVNFATGILLGGAVGGALSIPGVKSGIKAQVTALDEVGKKGIFQAAVPEAVPSGIKLGNGFQNRKVLENFIMESESALQSGIKTPGNEGLTTEIISRNLANAKASLQFANNEIRSIVNGITKDKQVGNYFADNILNLTSDDGLRATLGADEILRIGNINTRAAPTRGQGNLFGFNPSSPVDEDARVMWSTLWGVRKGAILDEMPKVATVADKVKLKSGQDIKSAVQSQLAKRRFRPSEGLDVGAHADLDTVQLRYLWAERMEFKPTAIIKVNQGDLPKLEAIQRQAEKFQKIQMVDAKGRVLQEVDSTDAQAVYGLLTREKDRLAQELMKSGKMEVEEIAERLNMSPGYLDGTAVSNSTTGKYLYRQAVAEELGLGSTEELFYRPKYMGIKNNSKITGLMNEFEGDAEALIRSYRKTAQQTIDAAVADAGALYGQGDFINPATGSVSKANYTAMLPDAEIVNEAVLSTDRFGAGARLFSFSNGNYGSAESIFQQIGSIKQRMDMEAANVINARLSPVLDLLRNNQAVAAEYSVTRELVAQSGEQYVLRDGKLRLKKIVDWEDAAGEGGDIPRPQLPPGVREEITFSNPRTAAVWEAHIDLNGARISGQSSLRAAEGNVLTKSPDVAYAIKPDPARLQFYAFVKDPTMTGQGKTTMVHARDAASLERMVNKIKQEFPQYKVILKSDAEDFYRARGEYEYDKTLHDNFIDSNLAARGINSQFLPRTDGNYLANELLDWHTRQAKAYNADIISSKYQTAFRELESMGRAYGGLNTSKYPDAVALATDTRRNPYVEYLKTALNISNVSEYPLLTGVNQFLDSVVTKLWNAGGDLLQRAKSKEDLEEINKIFQEQGFKTAYYDAATEMLVNHRADQNVLTKFVRGSNAILATTLLRFDFFNAINNKLGSTILTSTELRHVISQIEKGDVDTVGKLSRLAKVEVPGTGGDSILSPVKLLARAYQNFANDVIGGKNVLANRYREAGWIPANVGEIQRMVDSLTLNGTETTLQVNQKLQAGFDYAKRLADTGERWTGNRITETMNRFISADVMRQVTDLAVERGIISAREANSYINTFVNRTQVNITSAQRPLAFQGPVGMALGLFQSYQFNLMQQLFRYAVPGARKDLLMLGGMQSSFYGLNGLPGFQQFNEHILAQAAGNHEHSDLYSQLYGDLNYQTANFFLYGMPSNLLRANLFVRGDITPQHPTVLPGSFSEIASVAKFGQFFGAMKNMVTNAAGGAGVWNSVLDGLEHNGMNRPLAGLAQVVRGLGSGTGQVVSTARNGALISANDLWSLGTLARVAGGRPLDEAVFRDQQYRIQAYQAADREKRMELGALATRTFQQGEGEARVDYDRFLERYMELGGKQAGFNRWMMNNYMRSTSNQAADLRRILSDPYSQRLQAVLGGIADDSTFSIVAQQ